MAAHHAPVTAVPVSPSEPDVIDLGATRRLLQEKQDVRSDAEQGGATSWTCPACELEAGPFEPQEASWLADVHNRLMHRRSPVASTGHAAPALAAVTAV